MNGDFCILDYACGVQILNGATYEEDELEAIAWWMRNKIKGSTK
jgi:hypothetical protein